jgi:hypothetical protein
MEVDFLTVDAYPEMVTAAANYSSISEMIQWWMIQSRGVFSLIINRT